MNVDWRFKHLVLGGLAIFVCVVLTPVPATAQTTLEQIKKAGVVRVGIAGERPYGYIDDAGRVTGEAPEIARQIFTRIDPSIRLEGVQVPFGDLIEALRAGTIDIIAAGMYVTPERCEAIRFSAPTYKIGEAFVVRAGNPSALKNFADIARSRSTKIAIMAGAVEYNYAYEAGIPGDRALLYPDYDAALAALKHGDVDAVAMTALTARTLIQQRDLNDVEATAQFFPDLRGQQKAGYGAFGFRRNDTALYGAFTDHLKNFIDSSAHWETVRPFGFTKRMAPDKSTDALCAGGG